MVMLSKFNIWIFCIYFTSISSQKQDDLCPSINSILCVNDVLLDISISAKQIDIIGQQIERSIYETYSPQGTLDVYIDIKLKSIRLNLSSKYHQLINVGNNINRTSLINLIQEENYAFSYLYNSINNILKMDNNIRIYPEFFKKILDILRKDILCNYRNILYVYSANWLSIDEINGIQLLKTHKRAASSLIYNGHSIVVIKLLREWIKNVDEFVVNIKSKLYD